MTYEEIEKEAETFFEWPTDDKSGVSTISAMLFALYILEIEHESKQLGKL